VSHFIHIKFKDWIKSGNKYIDYVENLNKDNLDAGVVPAEVYQNLHIILFENEEDAIAFRLRFNV